MYVLRDRLITAEFWDFVLSTETCYFVNKRLKTGASALSAVLNGVEPNAELYRENRKHNLLLFETWSELIFPHVINMTLFNNKIWSFSRFFRFVLFCRIFTARSTMLKISRFLYGINLSLEYYNPWVRVENPFIYYHGIGSNDLKVIKHPFFLILLEKLLVLQQSFDKIA